MYQFKKRIPLMLDIKTMGWTFFFPIVLLLGLTIFLYITHHGHLSLIPFQSIKYTFGIFAMTGISIWIIGIFQDLLEIDSRELLLSFPYDAFYYGIFRVLRVTSIYLIIFLCLNLFLVSNHHQELSPSLLAKDFYFPIITIIYFAAFTFFIVMLTICCHRRLFFHFTADTFTWSGIATTVSLDQSKS